MVASAPAGFDRLVFVHVGKCAGTSVALGLRKFGARYEELHCLGATPRDPATHAHRMVERLSATRGSYFLIVVRDPVQRLISAFNYDLFFKRIQADRRGPDGRWAEIYDRFPTIDDLGLALGDTGSEQQWWARRALTASGLHLQFGLSWYIPPEIAHRFTPENSFVIRTEAAQSDFDRFCAQVLDPATDGVPLLTRELSDYRDQLPDGAQEVVAGGEARADAVEPSRVRRPGDLLPTGPDRISLPARHALRPGSGPGTDRLTGAAATSRGRSRPTFTSFASSGPAANPTESLMIGRVSGDHSTTSRAAVVIAAGRTTLPQSTMAGS